MREIATLHELEKNKRWENIYTRVLSYLKKEEKHSFESYRNYIIAGFTWYDIQRQTETDSKIVIYMTTEDLLLIIDDDETYRKIVDIKHGIHDVEQDGKEIEYLSNERFLFHLFSKLLQSDRNSLEVYEAEIISVADLVIAGVQAEPLQVIVSYRRELMRVGQYLESLASLFEEFYANDNGILSEEGMRLVDILCKRTARCQEFIIVLREHIEQMRESYQAQIDIRQNDLMRVFTVVTSIFMPATLLVGWYGMNFQMPELAWEYGYEMVTILGILVIILPLIYFKKKKWY